jgi:hypothetical protein
MPLSHDREKIPQVPELHVDRLLDRDDHCPREGNPLDDWRKIRR